MALYALILTGMVVETAAATFPVPSTMTWTGDISAVSPAPQPGWRATETAGAWAFAAPAAPPALDSRIAAKTALDASDVTMTRVSEAVALGLTTWTTADVVAYAEWRRAVRAIVRGTSTTASLPAMPAYPAGT